MSSAQCCASLTMHRRLVQTCYVALAVWFVFACGFPGWVPSGVVTTILATLILVTGVLHAVWVEERRASARQAAHKDDQVPPESDDEVDLVDNRHAYMMPVIGSAVLALLFLVSKFTGLMLLVSIYISGTGAFAVYSTLKEMPAVLNCGPTAKSILSSVYLRGAVGLGVAGAYIWTENFVLCNLLAISLHIMTARTMQLSTMRTGLIVLAGLFVYDCFWVFGSKPVFGSNVMVAVARGLQAPIKLIIPRLNDAGEVRMGLLGLGDIVVPALFMKNVLQFDRDQAYTNKARQFPSVFTATVVAYVASLVVTHWVMMMFQAAQPALLYIVPGVSLAALGAAHYHGELQKLLDWSIEVVDNEEDHTPTDETTRSAAAATSS